MRSAYSTAEMLLRVGQVRSPADQSPMVVVSLVDLALEDVKQMLARLDAFAIKTAVSAPADSSSKESKTDRVSENCGLCPHFLVAEPRPSAGRCIALVSGCIVLVFCVDV